MSPRHAFYQEVRLARPGADNTAFAGRTGVIVGRSDAPGEPPLYGVMLHGHESLVTCAEGELEPTGRQFCRADLYDDTRRLRVRVDKHGRGELA